jgi:capsular exopolysaccharide synthesis family protein
LVPKDSLRRSAVLFDPKRLRIADKTFGSTTPWAFTDDPHLVMIHRPGSPLAERYRRLRLRLEQGTFDDPLPRQLTVITSAVPAEGKTTTATNLALAYAEDRECLTLLVGADLRGPSVSRYVSPKPAFGLSHVLAGRVTLDDALVEMSGSGLFILPEGEKSEQRSRQLAHSDSIGELLDELRRRFDRIVIDTAPTVPFTDAALLASHADGVLLVVRAGTTTAPLIRRAWESLSAANVLGVVLNDVVFTIVDRYYSRYDDYAPGG